MSSLSNPILEQETQYKALVEETFLVTKEDKIEILKKAHFVKAADKYKCLICKCPVFSTREDKCVECQACETARFCRHCVERAEDLSSCPGCGDGEWSRKNLHTELQNQLEETLVKCQTCDLEMPYEQIIGDEHSLKCSHKQLLCPNGCSQVLISESHSLAHFNEC